ELAGGQILLTELAVALLDGSVGEEVVGAEAGEVADVVEVEVHGEPVGRAAGRPGERAVRIVLEARDRLTVPRSRQPELLEYQDVAGGALIARVRRVRRRGAEQERKCEQRGLQHDGPLSPATGTFARHFGFLRSIRVSPFLFRPASRGSCAVA